MDSKIYIVFLFRVNPNSNFKGNHLNNNNFKVRILQTISLNWDTVFGLGQDYCISYVVDFKQKLAFNHSFTFLWFVLCIYWFVWGSIFPIQESLSEFGNIFCTSLNFICLHNISSNIPGWNKLNLLQLNLQHIKLDSSKPNFIHLWNLRVLLF